MLAPSASLFALPWSLLPSLARSPLSVAPWVGHRKDREHQADGNRLVIAAGPGLTSADAELDSIEAAYVDGSMTRLDRATPDVLRRSLPECEIVHVASHAHFRADNPRFSSLDLFDGKLFVHDLETLERVPQLVVLSSCESGAVSPAGAAIRGFVALLLGAGTSSVIAATTSVPDTEHTAHVMGAFHEHLAAGSPPAAALHRARSSLVASDTPSLLAAHAFQCFSVV